MLQKLNHPNIVKMYGIFEDSLKGVFIVMELMEKGSLYGLIINKEDELTSEDLINFSIQGFIFLKKNKKKIFYFFFQILKFYFQTFRCIWNGIFIRKEDYS